MSFAYTTPDQVRTETSRYQLTRDRLLAQFPDLDDETLADTLEGITGLREMLAEVVRSALVDEALAKGLSTRLADMKERLQRFDERAKTKRSLVRQAMTGANLARLSEADFTVPFTQGPLHSRSWRKIKSQMLIGSRSQQNSTGRGFLAI